jgi:DNA helicase-2/ATP-dependent DNA helicase PcrA
MIEQLQATRIDARQIAHALSLPAPTSQQQAIIESPLTASLVIAGAGSGKTETMASRVIWLLANGLAEPADILGLTFTRKAARELAERFQARTEALRNAGFFHSDRDLFDAAMVATYNSFADSIYRDNAALLGQERDGIVLGEAAAWRLARRVVLASDDERLASLDKSAERITDAVLAISRSLAENVADDEAVAVMARTFAMTANLPAGGSGRYQEVDGWALTVGALDVLIDLAREYRRQKLLRGFVEYSDQVALALRIVQISPDVREEIRRRHRIVLLDEYQDTSVVQTTLLRTLFRGGSVMAVGDPNQSIYGWRGASAANLARFPEQFEATTTYPLTVSWRNGQRILAAANVIAAPLDTGAADTGRVATLQPAPAAGDFPVDACYLQTLTEESETVADWLAERLAVPAGQKATAALLLRSRTHQRVYLDALASRGVPFHVLGVGGLLEDPAVADLVCGLRVIADVSADGALARLLGGARWRIGIRDLRGLHRGAGWLATHDHAGRLLAEEARRRLRGSVASGEGDSLADAVDFATTAPDTHPAMAGISSEGLRRIREAGRLFARLRARRGLGLRELVALVRQELRIDVELMANEAVPFSADALDAFTDAIDDYLSIDDEGDLGGFLHWLADAARRDNLGPRPEEPEPGTVQVLTVHGAKGLEWDHVAVPMLSAQDFPSVSRSGSTGWLHLGELPYEFRGDREDMPPLAWQGASTRKELVDAVAGFKKDVAKRHDDEERRLAYVAVTRARHRLLLTSSFWSGERKKPTPAGTFLVELADAGLIVPPPEAPDVEVNPIDAGADKVVWPADPLGKRRSRVEAAARAVRDAPPGEAGAWQQDIDLLLEERRLRTGEAGLVRVPYRVPASHFRDYIHEPAVVAARLRRPMPQEPYSATLLGTVFHRWVEERSGNTPPPRELDAWQGPSTGTAGPREAEQLERLKSTFERSAWAHQKPIAVEREIHLPFEGHIVVCKIDAVYEHDGRHEIVDWKTGALPADDELAGRRLQLALYRLAYARWANREIESIDACFYFVAHDTVIRPDRLESHDELVALWNGVTNRG